MFIPTLVISENFLPMYGGTITWLIQTYSRYAPNEIVCAVGQHPEAHIVDATLPFPVQRLPLKMPSWDPTVPRAFWCYAQSLWGLQKSCRRYHIQQIHAIKALPEGLLAWEIGCLTKMPYILYAHGEEILIGETSRKLRWLLPRIYNKAKAIIANSYSTKTLLENIGVVAEKIHVIHPGVNVEAFRATSEEVLAIRRRHHLENSPVLLTVGRLQRRKGHDMVIRALPLIGKRFPAIKYLIVGSGEEANALQQLAQDIGVAEKVVFAGQVLDGEQGAYYSACDVFIMPNRQIGEDIEGFGIVFLEASAAGKPVIGGKSGGTGEAILEGVTGFRVDGTQAEAIATTVIDLLAEPDKSRAMGEQGRRRIESEFTWDSVAHRTRLLAASVQGNMQPQRKE